MPTILIYYMHKVLPVPNKTTLLSEIKILIATAYLLSKTLPSSFPSYDLPLALFSASSAGMMFSLYKSHSVVDKHLSGFSSGEVLKEYSASIFLIGIWRWDSHLESSPARSQTLF